jgi:hypothetical protein
MTLISIILNNCSIDILNNISDIIKEHGSEEENNMWRELNKKKLEAPNLITRKKWLGPGGMKELILEKTGCTPYTGAGINFRKDKHLTILKSVDNTPYYDDDLEDPNTPEYTLFGHDGDQDENERKFNEPLLNKSKTKDIYLYRQTNKEYIWYGKYEIIGKKVKSHRNKNNDHMRNIIILILKRCV